MSYGVFFIIMFIRKYEDWVNTLVSISLITWWIIVIYYRIIIIMHTMIKIKVSF